MSPEEIRGLMRRARRSVRSAEILLGHDDNDFAVSRAYYGMFYAATAGLLSRGIRRAKHSGVIGAFIQEFVKSERLDEEYARMLQEAFRDRGEGDYGGVFVTRERVERRLVEAERFIMAVEDVLREDGLFPEDDA